MHRRAIWIFGMLIWGIVQAPAYAITVEVAKIVRPPASATVDTENAGLTADTTLEAATANLRLHGFSVRENAGTPAAATVLIRHGVVSGSCTGDAIAYVELAANGSSTVWFGDRGVTVTSGVCADVLAGTVDVNIYRTTDPSP